MIAHLRLIMMFFLLIPLMAFATQEADEMKARIDSLENLQIQLREKSEKVHARSDSLNAEIRRELSKKSLVDTIIGSVEKNGHVYQQPDMSGKKLFRAKQGEIIVIVDFRTEWFKVIHKKGTGFILDECVKHDDKIFNYKKIKSELNAKTPEE